MDKEKILRGIEEIYLKTAERVFTETFVENYLKAYPERFLEPLRDRLVLPAPEKQGGISPVAQITIVTAIPRTQLDNVTVEGERLE